MLKKNLDTSQSTPGSLTLFGQGPVLETSFALGTTLDSQAPFPALLGTAVLMSQ